MRFVRDGKFGRPTVAVLVLICAGALVGMGCEGGVGMPVFIEGVGVIDSEVPELNIVQPDESFSLNQGEGLRIEWLDADRDSNALISFSLVSVDDPSFAIALVNGIEENNDGIGDRFTASTALIPLGSYTLRGTIDDTLNRLQSVVAFNRTSGLGEVIIQIVEEGTTATVNRPPQIFVVDPVFNRAVSQDDVLTITVQPTALAPLLNPAAGPFDPDSTATIYLVLDLDDDPLNDNVVRPEPSQIIPIADPLDVTEGDNLPIPFLVTIDLESIPIREDGQPYHIRATITDGSNNAVHSYAAGTINVVRSATGSVDLAQVGKTISGALFRGFNPGSRLGTRMTNITDFDQDGIDDFVLVAQFGNPRNFGNIGEAYLIYGLDNVRFGGEINVNSTARTISGAILEGPPTRCFNEECSVQEPDGGLDLKSYDNPRTDGITDVSAIPDLDGDGRPEILIGMAHVDGVYQSRDDDPDDDPPAGDETVGVNITLRQGTDGLEVDIEDAAEPVQGYFGVEDAIISSADPDRNFRAADLEWVNRAGNDTTYTLIKFKDILETFPAGDTSDRIAGAGGEIRFTVLNSGGGATIHELFTDFSAGTVTFNNFGLIGGGGPLPGVDYDITDDEGLGNIDAGDVGDVITVNVDELMQRLLIGDVLDNELRFIIVPNDVEEEDADDNARLGSSEFEDTRRRPSLALNYNREVVGGPLGCYPDLLPNNYSDLGDVDGDRGRNENKSEACGFVSVLHSRNRDNSGIVNPDRLDSTTVAIELIGQRARATALDSLIDAECEDDEEGHIAGARLQAGWYDFHDHLLQEQPPLNGLWGQHVSFIDDLDLNGTPEIVISAPQNELDLETNRANFGVNATHSQARDYTGSITVFPGADYDDAAWRDRPGEDGSSVIPFPQDQSGRACQDSGRCDPRNPVRRCGTDGPALFFGVFAEDIHDFLGGARSAGDFNRDSVPDLLCGAPLNDRTGNLVDSGAMYIVYLRTPTGDIRLELADDPFRRPPMLRVRGELPGDQIGWKQEPLIDVNGDRIDDIMFSSPTADFILPPPDCAALSSSIGLDSALFNACRTSTREDEVFLDDDCKVYDFNNDREVDGADRAVFDCLVGGEGIACCPVDNGYVGIIFGGVNRQGDRTISQVGTDELAGVVFYGTNAGDRAGFDISSAGDFDKDGFGDIIISAPGERRIDANGRERLGVTYLVFGGPHLQEQEAPIELSEIGERIPGIVFLSPYESGGPNEAPTDHVGFLGAINNDGFADVAIGVSRADLVDPQFPQGGGTFPETGRQPDQGDVYIIYGNNINR